MFHHVFRCSPVAIILSDRSDGRSVDVNPAAEKLLGYSRAELMVQHQVVWERVLPPDVREELLRLFAAQGRIESLPCTITTRSGDSRACLLSIESIEFEGQAYVLTHMVDVSAYRQTTLALREAEAEDDLTLAQDLADRAGLALANVRLYQDVQVAQQTAQQAHAQLHALISSVPIGIGYLDRDQCFQMVNPVLAAINGHSPAAHHGQHVSAILPDLAPRIEPLVRQVLATGITVSDVEIQDISINAIPLFRPGEASPFQVYTTFAARSPWASHACAMA
jgi:PAS domain S-box-containing protein